MRPVHVQLGSSVAGYTTPWPVQETCRAHRAAPGLTGERFQGGVRSMSYAQPSTLSDAVDVLPSAPVMYGGEMRMRGTPAESTNSRTFSTRRSPATVGPSTTS